MLDRDEIIGKLKDAGFGNYPHEEQANVLADLLLSTNPINPKDLQCNFSSLMYILTEQQALIGRLLEELLQAQVLNSASLQRVTDIYGSEEALSPVYTDLYRRFAWYFLQIKEAQKLENQKAPEPWDPTFTDGTGEPNNGSDRT